MANDSPQQRRVRRGQARGASAPPPDAGLSVALDLLQAELYRMIDEIARAGPGDHRALVAQFERAWQRFKDAVRAQG